MATVEAVMKLVTVLGILIYSSGAVLAQSTLRIVSPKEDAVFNPGQTVTVIVEATGGPFEEVFIVAGDPIGGSEEELATHLISSLSTYRGKSLQIVTFLRPRVIHPREVR